MNEYIFYTTEGFTATPVENQEIENCQVLGCAVGKNVADAKNNLIKENLWIVETGFDANQIIARQLLTEETKHDIAMLVQYFENQGVLYKETIPDKDTVYQTLQRLKENIL